MAHQDVGPGNRSSGAEAKGITGGDGNPLTKQTPNKQGRSLPDLEPDLAETKRFLKELAAGTERFTFQTFDDNQDRKARSLTRMLHGTLAEHAEELKRLNAAGAGVFVTVNETDLQGRAAKNVTEVRAAFCDLDGAPLAPVQVARPRVQIIVESSRERWHAYWRTFGVALDEFRELQKMLAAHFGGDPSVHDLPRVMRLPGFIHHKVKGGVASPPFRTRIVAINPGPLLDAAYFRRMCAATATTVVGGLDDELDAMMKADAGKGLDHTDDDLPPLTIAVAKAALAVIDPDIDQRGWFEICSALINELDDEVGFQLFKDWHTSKGEKHKLNKPGQLEKMWAYVKAKGYNFHAGTLVRAFKIAVPLVEAIKAQIAANQIDVMVVDPFIRTHAISENDNQRINAVADVWSTIAYDMKCAIELGHHTRKGSAKERGAYTVEDSRSAVALINAARSNRVLNQMTEDEAPRAQVKIKSRKQYFRVIDEKANMAPAPENSQWYKFESVILDNATAGQAADNVGVVVQFIRPQPMEVNVEIVRAIQQIFAQGNARADVRAGEKWGGHVVAQHLGIDLQGGDPEDIKANRHRVTALLKQWQACGWLRVENRQDAASRKQRGFFAVGQWAARDPNGPEGAM